MTVDPGTPDPSLPPAFKGLLSELAERLAAITAAIVGLAVALSIVRPIHLFLAQWLVWAFVFYISSYLLNRSTSRTSRKIRSLVFVALLALAVALGLFQFRYVSSASSHADLLSHFEMKMRQLRWIAYEPANFDPYSNTFGTLEQVQDELHALRAAGFTGIITFSSESILGKIPSLARDAKFEGVIMGIYDVSSHAELEAAAAAQNVVDAYCVGHMFTDTRFSDRQVLSAIRYIQRNTHKPITTTLRPNGYKAFPELSSTIDWFFPDIHGNWYDSASAKEVFKQTRTFISQVAGLQNTFPGKPILLKMISFPSEEVSGASLDEQYKFFRSVVEYMKSSMDFPERIYPSYFSAFDLRWKDPKHGWPRGERHLGFFTPDLTPKPAVGALVWTRTSVPDSEF